MKRIVIALSVDDDMDKHDIADCLGLGDDPTVWEWSDFWADVRDSVVGPVGDTTRTDLPVDPEAGVRYYPWTDGYAVGFRAVNADGIEHFVYLNPSAGGDDPEHQPNVFVYDGTAGDPSIDTPSVHINLFEGVGN